jgi:hypothetical protein
MAVFGMALLRRVARFLTPLENIAYGAPLGVVVASLSMFGIACLVGLSRVGVLWCGLLCTVGAILMWPWQATVICLGERLAKLVIWFLRPLRIGSGRRTALHARRWEFTRVLPIIVLGTFFVRWAFLWSNALTYEDDGLRAGHVYIWGDWPQHLGDVASFAYSDNFPPQHPRLVGHAYDYHYLSAFTAAAAVKLGVDPAFALTTQSFIFSVLLALGLYAFALRLTMSRSIATLVLVLFFLGGSLGWLVTATDINRTHSIWGTLTQQPWDGGDQDRANFQWMNIYFAFIMAQRGYLYGLPLALLIFTLLFQAVQNYAHRLFIIAGVVAGLLPLAHLSTLLALAIITPCCFLLFPSRRWVWFFVVWIAIALPQLYAQQHGSRGATAAMQIHLGWVAAPDAWLWFWLKNLGWFLPLLIFALSDRTLLPRASRRFLWAFMPLFAIANVAQFQPWVWDNHKMMVYWFLAVCIMVAALLHKLWCKTPGNIPLRFLIASVTASVLLSGLLLNLQELLGKDRHGLLSTEEVMLAEAVRELTPPHAIFVVGLQNNHPVPTLAGREILMGYPGWLWTHGLDVSERERDVRAIYAMKPNTSQLLAKYNVDYVVIGPDESANLKANAAAYRTRYPLLLRTQSYEIFSVKEDRIQRNSP